MSLRWSALVCAIAIFAGALSTACHPTFVVLPGPEADSTADTVSYRDGEEHFPVTGEVRIDTVYRTRTIVRTDTFVRTDTVVRVDTVRLVRPGRGRVDTVLRVDTVVRVDSLRIPFHRTDTVRVAVTDTVVRVDTVHSVVQVPVTITDTVVIADTVRVPGRRFLLLPPGHYPPAGQCRVWVHGEPPGQQAQAAACDELGVIPGGAFILFAGDAWDFDYDWVAESEARPGTVPPQIIALQRGGPGANRAAARGRRPGS
jgi:hypothetical protein